MQVFGNINSFEPCSVVSGPGTRFVVCLQGCPMRCLYCNKPETWDFAVNQKMSVDDVMLRYSKAAESLKNGGLTVSGGEPLMQADFVCALFKKAKEKNIHTVLDTAGVMFNKANTAKIDNLLSYTDLVILDIKHSDPVEHNKLTAQPLASVLDFAKYLSDKKIPVWIRHVVIPGVNSSQAQLKKAGEIFAALNNIQSLEIVPYLNSAAEKYEHSGKPFALKGIPSLSKQEALEAKNIVLEAMRNKKLNG